MGTLVAIITLFFIGMFFTYYMREDRDNQTQLVLDQKISVARWMLVTVCVLLIMNLIVLFGTYFGEDLQVKKIMVPVSATTIWLPIFGLIYYSSLSLLLTESYLERSSIFGKKRISYDQISRVESLAQGMYALHLKSKKRVVIEPIFKQSPKIKSYLQDVAYKNKYG
jgi:magnesium-transporting ATPase (P-type)